MWAKLRQNLGKNGVKFGKKCLSASLGKVNCEIWAKAKFGQKPKDLGKFDIWQNQYLALASPKSSDLPQQSGRGNYKHF